MLDPPFRSQEREFFIVDVFFPALTDARFGDPDFSDMAAWVFVALVLAVMSFFGMREKKRNAGSQARGR